MRRSGIGWAVAAVVQAVAIAVLGAALLQRGQPAVAPAPTAPSSALPADPAPPNDHREPEVQVEHDVGHAQPAVDSLEGAARASSRTRTAVLHGRVTGPHGAPVPIATVTLKPAADPEAPPAERLRLQRSDDGHFVVPDVSPGRYRLDVAASRFRARAVEFDVPVGADAVRQDVQLEATWELRVRIDTPDGQPLHEAIAAQRTDRFDLRTLRVDAVATPFAPPPQFAPSALKRLPFGSGRWSGAGVDSFLDPSRTLLPKRYAGLLELPEDRPMYVSAVLRSVVLASERVEPGQAELRLVVPLDAVMRRLCTVRLQVTDAASGQPVTAARAALSDAHSRERGEAVDEAGRVALRRSAPGRHELDVTAPGYAAVGYVVDLEPGATVDLGVVPLHPEVRVPLTFSGIAPDADVRVVVSCLDAPPHPALHQRMESHRFSKAGDAALTLFPGRWHVVANTEGTCGVLEFVVAPAVVGTVTVPMAAAAKLRVVPPPSERSCELTLVDGAGRTLFSRWVTWTTPVDVTFPAGSYVARIVRDDGSVDERNVSLSAAGAELDLR